MECRLSLGFVRVVIMGLFTMAFLSVGCSKKSKPTTTSAEYFILGSGGGVTGDYEEFKVFETGRIVVIKSREFSSETGLDLSASDQSHIWSEYTAMNLSEIQLDDPGNFNYYIKIPKGGTFHTIQWNDESMVPDRLSDFHYDSYQAIRKTILQ